MIVMDSADIPFFPKILDTLCNVPNVSSIYLIGSAARGELSAITIDGNIELYSDVEFCVVTNGRIDSISRKNLFTSLAEIEQAIVNPNPLFHIDILLRDKLWLSRMPRTIFTFEFKKNGKLLLGKDTKKRLPDVTLHNLDYRDANEILYKRLWALLLYLPKRWLLENLSPSEIRVAGYIFCRNALDITTVLLPQADILLPTYCQRVEKLSAVYSFLPFAQHLGNGFPDFMQMCLKHRLDLDFDHIALETLYAETIHYLKLALLCVSGSEQNNLIDFHSGYNEFPTAPRQWLNLIQLGRQMIHRKGIHSAFQWLLLPKKEILAQGLLAMHLALLAWKQGHVTEAEGYLAHSIEKLNQLTGKEFSDSLATFSVKWQNLRKKWGVFWGDFIRLGDPRYPMRFEAIMDWQHD